MGAWRPALWVGHLEISERTAQKLRALHHLDPEQVRLAVECRSGLVYTWNTHPERGTRAMIDTFVGNRRVLVVLYPIPGDPFGDGFNLGSAYPVEG